MIWSELFSNFLQNGQNSQRYAAADEGSDQLRVREHGAAGGNLLIDFFAYHTMKAQLRQAALSFWKGLLQFGIQGHLPAVMIGVQKMVGLVAQGL
ncbi:MAG: hypothetical protein IKJ99_00270, partial [Oscillospiraceae bacterium]|nr:hypothetical protein [Oscillospiraceae bacterium]